MSTYVNVMKKNPTHRVLPLNMRFIVNGHKMHSRKRKMDPNSYDSSKKNHDEIKHILRTCITRLYNVKGAQLSVFSSIRRSDVNISPG